MLAFRRPGFGLPPSAFDRVVGKVAVTPIGVDEMITDDRIR